MNTVQEFKKIIKKHKIKKHDISVLNNIRLNFNSNLTIYNTNLEESVLTETDNITAIKDTLVVDYKELANVIDSLKESSLELKLNNNVLLVNNIPVSLKYQNDYPEPSKSQLLQEIVLSKEDIKSIMKASEFAEDSKGTREVLKYICIDKENIVTTDGFKLFCQPHKIPSITKPVLFKASLVDKLKSLKEVTLKIYEKQIAFADDITSFFSKTPENNYPNYKVFFPESYDLKKINQFAKKELLRELEVIKNLKPDNSCVELIAEKNVLTLKCYIKNNGYVKTLENIIDKGYEDFRKAFNVQYLITCLKTIEIDYVGLYEDINSKGKIIFKDNYRTLLLMEIRL